jgi:hypothetical protein
MTVAASAAAVSSASGWLLAKVGITGLSVTISQAYGAINPPFAAGALPPGLEAIVYVSSALAATVSVAQPPAVVVTITVEVTVSVDIDEAIITTDQITAEVT